MGKTILVTGGTGYIGSHTIVELLENGFSVVAVDNLSNSSDKVLARIGEITGKTPFFYKTDILDKAALQVVFDSHAIDTVIHFAGLKAVGESVRMPLAYYRNNVSGTVALLEVMARNSVKNIVFSSSATVYGDPDTLPLTENAPVKTTSTYGNTKLFIENILKDLYQSDTAWNIALLRYFNPAGAHGSGKIGEDPADIPNNLMPFISRTAAGKLDCLKVFGDDYPTPDGTGIRDYIHVTDLAKGHTAALSKLDTHPGRVTYNLGTGRGYSVLEIVTAFERVNNIKIPYKIVERRAGDIAACWADPAKAKKELNWQAERGLDDMVRDAWNFQRNNPDGYEQRD